MLATAFLVADAAVLVGCCCVLGLGFSCVRELREIVCACVVVFLFLVLVLCAFKATAAAAAAARRCCADDVDERFVDGG